MYFPGFGSCSTLLHLVAKYPIGALAVGIFALTSYVVSPVGPGVYYGTTGIMRQQEAKMLQANPALQGQLERVTTAFKEAQNTPLADSTIQYVLDLCQQCSGVTVNEVRHDSTLMHDVAFIYFVDLCQKHGVDEAKVIYAIQH